MHCKLVRVVNGKRVSPSTKDPNWQVEYIPDVIVSAKIGKLFVYASTEYAEAATLWSTRDLRHNLELWTCEVTGVIPCPERVPLGHFEGLYEQFWIGTWDPTDHYMYVGCAYRINLVDTVELVHQIA